MLSTSEGLCSPPSGHRRVRGCSGKRKWGLISTFVSCLWVSWRGCRDGRKRVHEAGKGPGSCGKISPDLYRLSHPGKRMRYWKLLAEMQRAPSFGSAWRPRAHQSLSNLMLPASNPDLLAASSLGLDRETALGLFHPQVLLPRICRRFPEDKTLWMPGSMPG